MKPTYGETMKQIEAELAEARQRRQRIREELDTEWRIGLEYELQGQPNPAHQREVEALKAELHEAEARVAALERRLGETRKACEGEEYKRQCAEVRKRRDQALGVVEEMLGLAARGAELRRKTVQLAEQEVAQCYKWNGDSSPPRGGYLPDGKPWLRAMVAPRIGELVGILFARDGRLLEAEVRRAIAIVAADEPTANLPGKDDK